MMQKMSFGKYQGKSVAYVVLKDFEYFIWMYQNNMSNRPEYTEALRLLQILDAKPFYQKCYSCRQKAAAKFSLYHGGVAAPSFFCEECDPYSQGAIRGKLAIYSSLRDVVNCGIPYKNYINTVIACVAEAKGFPKRKTEKALEDFFGIQIKKNAIEPEALILQGFWPLCVDIQNISEPIGVQNKKSVGL